MPPHDEAFESHQVSLTALGKEQVNRGVRDYKAALRELIQGVKANPAAASVIFGYFLERPSPALRRRLQEVSKTLEQSGLSPTRYLVRPMSWNDDFTNRAESCSEIGVWISTG